MPSNSTCRQPSALLIARTKTVVEVVQPDGGVAWKQTVVGTRVVQSVCTADGMLRVTRMGTDGGIEKLTRDLRAHDADVLSCSATVLDGTPLSVSTGRVRTPPSALKVELVETDDSSGHAVFRITNDTDDPLVVEDTPFDGRRVSMIDDDCWASMIRPIPAHSTLDLATREIFCAHPLSAGVHRRAITIGRFEWPDDDSFEFEFPFTARPSSRPVVFPDVDARAARLNIARPTELALHGAHHRVTMRR